LQIIIYEIVFYFSRTNPWEQLATFAKWLSGQAIILLQREPILRPEFVVRILPPADRLCVHAATMALGLVDKALEAGAVDDVLAVFGELLWRRVMVETDLIAH
jgi:hypothetical protein